MDGAEHCPQKKTGEVPGGTPTALSGPFPQCRALRPWEAPRPDRCSREPAALHPPGSREEALGRQGQAVADAPASVFSSSSSGGQENEGRKERSSWDTCTHLSPAAFEKQIEQLRVKRIKRGGGQTVRHLLSQPLEDHRHPPCGPEGSPEPGTPQEGQSSGAASSKGAIKALGKINATGTDPRSASCNMPASCSRPGKLPDL